MDHLKIKEYKKKLDAKYPLYTSAIEKSKSEEEKHLLHEAFLKDAKADMDKAFINLSAELKQLKMTDVLSSINVEHDKDQIQKVITSLQANSSTTNPSETIAILLQPQLLEKLIHAEGHDIEVQVQKILDGVERLSNMTDDDAIAVSLQIVGFSAAAIGLIAGSVTLYQLLTLSGAFTVSATLAGVVAATVAVVTAIAAFVVLAVLIPIIYFMKKPAVCMVLLINELDGGPALKNNSLEFIDSHNVHGKPTLITTPIPGAYYSPNGTYAYSGLFSTSKRDEALIGTQCGFQFKCEYKSSKGTKEISFAFGVENPLTSIYKDNNCYCGFDISAEEAAQNTDKNNKQTYAAENEDGIKLSIKCNSKGGSVAYYIARVYV